MISSDTMDKMIEDNAYLVRCIAAQFKNSHLPMEDLIQEGMIGLLEAVHHFDEEKDTKFSTYASYWIKKYILMATEKESKYSLGAVEMDTNVAENIKAPEHSTSREGNVKSLTLPEDMPLIEQVILRFSYQYCKTIKEIASELDTTPEKVRQIRQKALRRLKGLYHLKRNA